MKHGFVRVACGSPPLAVADCGKNARALIKMIQDAAEQDVSLAVFPELSITAYTCGDLFLQRTLQSAAVSALELIANETADTECLE